MAENQIGSVEFKGFQTGEPLKNYIRNARCAVLPSEWYENGPYSAMEAMALGKPLIVSNNGGLPELVEDGVNGYVYADAEALSECLKRMMALPTEQYQAMAQSSLKKAKEMFDPHRYVEKLMEAYNEVIG